MERAGDERDLLVTKRGKMLDRLPNPMEIVDANIANSGSRWTDVHKYQRNLSQLKILKQYVFHAESHNRDSLDSAFDHSPHCRLHVHGVVPRGCQHDFVMMLNGNSLEDLYNLREKWICDVGDNEAENAAAARH